jgi:hypothetical protein
MLAMLVRAMSLALNATVYSNLMQDPNTCIMYSFFVGSTSILVGLVYYSLYKILVAAFTFVMSNKMMRFSRKRRCIEGNNFEDGRVAGKTQFIEGDMLDNVTVSSTFDDNVSLGSITLEESFEEQDGEIVEINIEGGEMVTRQMTVDREDITMSEWSRDDDHTKRTQHRRNSRFSEENREIPSGLYSARVIWRNVYGLGGGMYLLVIVMQFSNDMAVLSALASFTVNAFLEMRCSGFSRCRAGCILSACVYILLSAIVLIWHDNSRSYTTGEMIFSICILGNVPTLLKTIRKPDNIIQTIKLSMPCTCMISFIVFTVSIYHLHPCILNGIGLVSRIIPIPSTTTPNTDSGSSIVVLNADEILTTILVPLTTLASAMTIIGAILQNRSIDIASGMALTHGVQIYLRCGAAQPSQYWALAALICALCNNILLLISYSQCLKK